MGSWPPRRVRVPPSGLGNGTLLGYGVFRMESHQDEAPPDAGGPYPGDWRPHETREGWTQTRARDNVRRRCTRRRPRDAAAAIGAARATAGGGGRWREERPGQAGPQTPGGSRPRTPRSAVPRGSAERNVAARRSRSCRLTDQPTWDSLTQKGPPAPRLSPRRPRGRWVFQLRGGD